MRATLYDKRYSTISSSVVKKPIRSRVRVAGVSIHHLVSIVMLLTSNKPAGEAAETLLPEHGFCDQIEYQYVSIEYRTNYCELVQQPVIVPSLRELLFHQLDS